MPDNPPNPNLADLSFAAWSALQPVEIPSGPPAPRQGELCPHCGQGRMDYDGLLNLACPACGYHLSGGAGCT